MVKARRIESKGWLEFAQNLTFERGHLIHSAWMHCKVVLEENLRTVWLCLSLAKFGSSSRFGIGLGSHHRWKRRPLQPNEELSVRDGY